MATLYVTEILGDDDELEPLAADQARRAVGDRRREHGEQRGEAHGSGALGS